MPRTATRRTPVRSAATSSLVTSSRTGPRSTRRFYTGLLRIAPENGPWRIPRRALWTRDEVSTLGTRRLSRGKWLVPARRAPPYGRPRAACRRPRIRALLARGAPQHERHRQLGSGGHDRTRGAGDDAHPCRLGGHHAPEPRPIEGRGDLPAARSAPPRTHRSRARAGARDRPTHGIRAATLEGGDRGE